MNNFLDLVKQRRTIYQISNKPTISSAKLQELVETAVNHTPSAFNSQTSRVVLLLDAEHQKFWNIVLTALQPLVSGDALAKTSEKIAGLAAGFTTILFFEETETVQAMQKQVPLYADNFPIWSQHSSAMLQYVIWTALTEEGLGASLQHYNPLIDAEVIKAWNLPESWQLIAQMAVGAPTAPAGEKTFLPIETRVKTFGRLSN